MKRIFAALLIGLLLFACIRPDAASADMGPKPSVTVHVINAPECRYYIDFLQSKTAEGRGGSHEPPDNPDDKMECLLREYEEGGYVARCMGDMGPISRSSTVCPDESNTVKFSYMVPGRFRMIIVTENLDVITTNEIDPIRFNAEAAFNAETGTLTEISAELMRESAAFSREILLLWLKTSLATVVIETLVMLLCRIRLRRREWLLFAGLQCLTQILLYGVIYALGYFYVLYAEPIIWAVEILAMRALVKTDDKKRLSWAVLAANLVSFACTAIPFSRLVTKLYETI